MNQETVYLEKNNRYFITEQQLNLLLHYAVTDNYSKFSALHQEIQIKQFIGKLNEIIEFKRR